MHARMKNQNNPNIIHPGSVHMMFYSRDWLIPSIIDFISQQYLGEGWGVEVIESGAY